MYIKDFYDILDAELHQEIQQSTDAQFKKLKQNNQKKSYAFLIWFLKFYGQSPSIKEYITDGSGDSSCDIIFSKTDLFGKTIFYVVQSKWSNKNNCESMLDTQEVKYTLNDFETILRGDRGETENQKFNQKYRELIDHLQNNGEVKFLFLCLALSNPKVEENIQSFQNAYPNVNAEIIDIKKIRRDYIEFNYKGLTTESPLEYNYSPEESKIILPIERFGEYGNRDFIDYAGPSKAYILIIKPKTIFELFEKYKLSLFYKNVRNPLIQSRYNHEIKETLEKRPGSFWYFNNGITAITKLVPDIGVQARQVELIGLQVINGAQTIYSVYLAYKEANAVQREIMDTDARITLRLIRSSDEKFSMEITRYTNSQNEIEAFDFMSNDDVQVRLQNESFNTPVWYSRRRGEFLEDQLPDQVMIIPNFDFAIAYTIFYLQSPYDVIENKDMIFISRLDHPNGLYEKVFNESTRYEDILASYFISSFINVITQDRFTAISEKTGQYRIIEIISYNMLALMKIYLEKYFNYTNQSTINISRYINQAFQKQIDNNIFVISQIIELTADYIISINTEDLIQKSVESNQYYFTIADMLKELDLTDKFTEKFDSN